MSDLRYEVKEKYLKAYFTGWSDPCPEETRHQSNMIIAKMWFPVEELAASLKRNHLRKQKELSEAELWHIKSEGL